MTRVIRAFLFLVGFMGAAWCAYLVLGVQPDAASQDVFSLIEDDNTGFPSSGQSIVESPDVPNPRSVDMRSVVNSVDQFDNVGLLLSKISDLTHASSPRSRLELRLFLARLIERDPELTTLKSIGNVRISWAIANALLDVLGDDEASIERILATLPRVDSLTFRVDAATHAFESDPDGALARVLSSNDAVFQREAIQGLAVAWAEKDPIAALANAGRILEPRLRESFAREVLQRWAQIEPAGALTYLRNADPTVISQLGSSLETLSSTFDILAMSDPEQVLDLSRELGRWNLFEAAATSAIRSLAEQDPEAAVSYLDLLPQGQEYRSWRAAVAAGYVDRDPLAALAWAQSLSPPSPGAINAVMTAFAAKDLERAVDIAVAEIARGTSLGIDPREWTVQAAESVTMAKIGTRIASLGPDSASRWMPWFAELWSESDPDAALAWALDNAEIGEQMLPRLARSDRPETFELGMTMADEMQGDSRTQWVQRMVRTIGLRDLVSDPAGFDHVLMRFSSDPSFPAMIESLADSVASRAGRFGSSDEAVRIVSSLPDGALRSAIAQRIEEQQQ